MGKGNVVIALVAVFVCGWAGFMAARSWGQGVRVKQGTFLKVAAVLLVTAGLIAFFCGAFTE